MSNTVPSRGLPGQHAFQGRPDEVADALSQAVDEACGRTTGTGVTAGPEPDAVVPVARQQPDAALSNHSVGDTASAPLLA